MSDAVAPLCGSDDGLRLEACHVASRALARLFCFIDRFHLYGQPNLTR
jgi:hypothetical protein